MQAVAVQQLGASAEIDWLGAVELLAKVGTATSVGLVALGTVLNSLFKCRGYREARLAEQRAQIDVAVAEATSAARPGLEAASEAAAARHTQRVLKQLHDLEERYRKEVLPLEVCIPGHAAASVQSRSCVRGFSCGAGFPIV